DPLMLRQEHDPHRAAAELGDEPVIAEHIANHCIASAQECESPGTKWEALLTPAGNLLAPGGEPVLRLEPPSSITEVRGARERRARPQKLLRAAIRGLPGRERRAQNT